MSQFFCSNHPTILEAIGAFTIGGIILMAAFGLIALGR